MEKSENIISLNKPEGELLRLAIRNSGNTIENAAKALNVSRSNLHAQLNKAFLEPSFKQKVKDCLNIDIEKETRIGFSKFDVLADLKRRDISIEEAAERLKVSRRTFYNILDKVDAQQLSSADFYNFVDVVGLSINLYRDYKQQQGSSEPTLEPLGTPEYTMPYKYLNGISLKHFYGSLLPTGIYKTLEIHDNTMAPEIRKGDVIVAQIVNKEFWEDIGDFFIYILIINKNDIISRVYKESDTSWLLKKDNVPGVTKMQVESIEDLYLVKMIIKRKEPQPKMFDINEAINPEQNPEQNNSK